MRLLHAVTLCQNRRQFHTMDHTRNAASGKTFMQDRTSEGPTRRCEDSLFLKACGWPLATYVMLVEWLSSAHSGHSVDDTRSAAPL